MRRWDGRWSPPSMGGAIVVVVAIGFSFLGVWVDPRREAFSYLAAYAMVASIVLGALAFVMIAHVTRAHWMGPLLPLARATAATLPILAILFLPVLAGRYELYPWVQPLAPMPEDIRRHILEKSGYLNVPFFVGRAALYFLIWIVLAEVLVRGSASTRRLWSAVGLPPYAFAVSFASVDWLMSLSPAWWSSIYGVYFWTGGFLGLLAWLAVAGDTGQPPYAPSPRSNTLARLILAFVLFWAYIGFSQFLIIWIADIPLDVSWLAPRLAPNWELASLILLISQFVLPFLLLLPRHNRERPSVLAAIGLGLLFAHYLDIYWLVLPSYSPGKVTPNWLDITNLIAVAGITLAYGGWRFRRSAPELTPEEVAVAWR